MKQYRSVRIGDATYKILISDEQEALLAVYAAGGAVLGVETGETLSGIPYVTDCWEAADQERAEQVVRRRLGLPWNICETKRLLIRELTEDDHGQIRQEEYADKETVFREPEALKEYIRTQYGFYEYGIWAVIEQSTGLLVGLAGLTGRQLSGDVEGEADYSEPVLEIGYHIWKPFRKRGYGREAAAAVKEYGNTYLGVRICARIEKENHASRKIAEELGLVSSGRLFRAADQRASQWSGEYLLYEEMR